MGVILTNEMITGALEVQEKYNIPASVTLGQIMLESGGSYSGGLSKLAYKDKNLFGVKAGSSWNGATVQYQTQEQGANGMYTTTATFRKYDSYADSIEDHAKLLSSSTYTNKTKGATTLSDYVHRMGSVYATDSEYANKLMNTIESNGLTKYDTGVYPTTTTTTTTTEKKSDGGHWWEIDWDGILANIVRVIAIILILCMGVVFFLKAFDIPTSKTDLIKSVVKGDEE